MKAQKDVMYFYGYPMRIIADSKAGGGWFTFPGSDDKDKCGQISIGLDVDTWESVEETIFHECLEFAMTSQELRYHTDGYVPRATSSGSLFIFNHSQFEDICIRAGTAMQQCREYLRPIWRTLQAGKKKEKV